MHSLRSQCFAAPEDLRGTAQCVRASEKVEVSCGRERGSQCHGAMSKRPTRIPYWAIDTSTNTILGACGDGPARIYYLSNHPPPQYSAPQEKVGKRRRFNWVRRLSGGEFILNELELTFCLKVKGYVYLGERGQY